MFLMKPRKKFDVVSIKYFLGGENKGDMVKVSCTKLKQQSCE
jgi:hypothetical protein